MSVTVKEILKGRRLELELTLEDVAKRVGVSPATISRWESGDIANMRRDRIAALAKALQISPAVIMGWDVDTPIPPGAHRPQFKKVPMLGYAAAGQPLEDLNQDTPYYDVDNKYDVDFCITVRGDSMINAGINDGDIIIIHRGMSVESGEIGVVRVSDESATLKRVFYENGNKIRLQPENSSMQPIIVDINDVEIVGKLIGLYREY